MAWQQLRLTVNAACYPSLAELLENMGALSLSLTDAHDNAIYEPAPGTTPLWEEALLNALFTDIQDLTPLLKILHALGFTDITQHIVPDQAWERVCMDQFQPMRFGEKLWICPSWHQIEDPHAIVIQLDPGLAFGTGSHPTTKLCLEWIAIENLINKTVIDYGCGSGILAIAALKCGANHVYAVDIDPQACQATQENMLRNQLTTSHYWIGAPEDLLHTLSVDIIIANILALPLIDLAAHFGAHLKPGGQIVLSGILVEQQTKIQEAYAADFQLEPPVVEGEWLRMVGMKK